MLGKKIKRAATNNQVNSEAQSHPKAKLTKQTNKETPSTDITSPFFETMQFWQKIYDAECRLSDELRAISFLSSDISAVYNPIEYAADLHCKYLKKFLNQPKPVVFIGMNPGPFGMAQTGVTFHSIHLNLLHILQFISLNGSDANQLSYCAAHSHSHLSLIRMK